MFRELHDQGTHWPDPIALSKDGDYRIFVEGEAEATHFVSFSADPDPHGLLKSGRRGARNSRDIGQESPTFDPQSWCTKGAGPVWSRNPRNSRYFEHSASPALSLDTCSTSFESIPLAIPLLDRVEDPSLPVTDSETRSTARLSSISGFASAPNVSGLGFQTQMADLASHVAFTSPAMALKNWLPER